jgi:hypothetical protein
MTHTKDEALKLAKECGATTYTNRHYPDATAVTFSPLAWEKFCEQALAAPPVQEHLAWGIFYFGGKQDGKLYSHADTEENAKRYIADLHQSNDCDTFRAAPIYTTPPAQPAPVQEPCRECAGEGIQGEDGDGFVSGVTWRCDSCNGTGKSTPPAAQRQRVVFPTMLRKMWSGGEVQAWLDETVNKENT